MPDRTPSTATASIPLTQGQVALVDPADMPGLVRSNWCALRGRLGKFVAVRGSRTPSGAYRLMYMHREIMGLVYGDPLEVDHINHNTLDNRRSNLRVVTSLANKRWQPSRGGSSRFVGVTWIKKRQAWGAQISVDGVVKNLGRYDTEEEAAMARDRYVRDNATGHEVNFP